MERTPSRLQVRKGATMEPTMLDANRRRTANGELGQAAADTGTPGRNEGDPGRNEIDPGERSAQGNAGTNVEESVSEEGEVITDWILDRNDKRDAPNFSVKPVLFENFGFWKYIDDYANFTKLTNDLIDHEEKTIMDWIEDVPELMKSSESIGRWKTFFDKLFKEYQGLEHVICTPELYDPRRQKYAIRGLDQESPMHTAFYVERFCKHICKRLIGKKVQLSQLNKIDGNATICDIWKFVKGFKDVKLTETLSLAFAACSYATRYDQKMDDYVKHKHLMSVLVPTNIHLQFVVAMNNTNSIQGQMVDAYVRAVDEGNVRAFNQVMENYFLKWKNNKKGF
ncbi:uncharacterized protein J8A68_001598 [[Candida] subhashii]|uniref:Uncharacterized protein n=1 Tax=[Candida] subhashii TaxID=561895 RepID=A0A8J5QKR7_9ASCO|nr:uncharacterized protein J8A68_001598 [[Candida] subhashii]KAG7664872.1 hypothetical protein J8A68_001598 [[Candida] subhashii]